MVSPNTLKVHLSLTKEVVTPGYTTKCALKRRNSPIETSSNLSCFTENSSGAGSRLSYAFGERCNNSPIKQRKRKLLDNFDMDMDSINKSKLARLAGSSTPNKPDTNENTPPSAKSKGMKTFKECLGCGKSFSRLGTHLRFSSICCSKISISQLQNSLQNLQICDKSLDSNSDKIDNFAPESQINYLDLNEEVKVFDRILAYLLKENPVIEPFMKCETLNELFSAIDEFIKLVENQTTAFTEGPSVEATSSASNSDDQKVSESNSNGSTAVCLFNEIEEVSFWDDLYSCFVRCDCIPGFADDKCQGFPCITAEKLIKELEKGKEFDDFVQMLDGEEDNLEATLGLYEI